MIVERVPEGQSACMPAPDRAHQNLQLIDRVSALNTRCVRSLLSVDRGLAQGKHEAAIKHGTVLSCDTTD
jgi:hypothetical protein